MFLSTKLVQLRGSKVEKEKTEFIVMDSSAMEKIKSKLEEEKKLIIYQYSILNEEQMKQTR